jgi:hypothetical protein
MAGFPVVVAEVLQMYATLLEHELGLRYDVKTRSPIPWQVMQFPQKYNINAQ